jgi:Tfp pilus assembly protein PilO
MIKIQDLKNPKNLKNLAIIISLLIICVLTFKNSLSLFSKNIKLKEEIKAKDLLLARGQGSSASQVKVSAEINKISQELLDTEKQFSSNAEEVFSTLNKFAEGSGISLKGISPLDKKETKIPDSLDIFSEMPVSLKLKCGYFELIAFLEKLENSDKIIFIEEIKIGPDQKNIWEHEIELLLKVPMSV